MAEPTQLSVYNVSVSMANPPSTTHNAFASPFPVLSSHPIEPPKPILISRPTPVKKASLPPPHPLPSSLPVSPQPPQQSLSDHLYRSLKSGACADVRIWVRRWNVGWLVHKMVLVQAGESLLLFGSGWTRKQLTPSRLLSIFVHGRLPRGRTPTSHGPE